MAVIVYVLIFTADWGVVKTEKNDRRLFFLTCAVGVIFVTLIMHGVKIPSPVIGITNVLDFLGFHY